MPIDRRAFLGTSAAWALAMPLGGCRSMSGEKPLLTVGALADTHICDREGLDCLALTLRRFRQEDVQAVVHAGDITNNGLRSELEAFAETWHAVFPDGCGTELFAVYGNRDFKQSTITDSEERVRNAAISVYSDPFGCWERCFGRTIDGIYARKIAGFTFVGASWGQERGQLDDFLSARPGLLPADKPFFYVQHPHPKGTCFAPQAAADAGFVTRTLAAHPNAIAVSGHAHQSLADERAFWRGAFLSFGPGAHWAVKKFLGSKEHRTAHQSAVMRLYVDRLVISRLDCVTGSLGSDWTVPLPYRPGSCP